MVIRRLSNFCPDTCNYMTHVSLMVVMVVMVCGLPLKDAQRAGGLKPLRVDAPFGENQTF